jgi:hypothetical protein
MLVALQALTVPQSYFTHFYVVGTVWNTVILQACATAITRTSDTTTLPSREVADQQALTTIKRLISIAEEKTIH